MKAQLKQRRIFIIVISTVLLAFGASLTAVLYYGGQALAKQQAEQQSKLAQYDKQLAALKAKKAAEKKAKEEADKKAAEQKAAADAALAAQQAGKTVTPKGCAISGAHGDPNAIDVVVNKKHCFNPIDFVPRDLTGFQGFLVSAKIVPDLEAMFSAAAAAGVQLNMTSSYRSYANQVVTYNNWVRVNGSTAAADTVSARPGYSEHQTGFAIDMSAGNCSLECFLGSAQYTWMQEHGAEYGFIQRYPIGYESITGYNSEAWHYRYVGKAIALDMKQRGIKTLEQLWGITGGGY